MSARPTTPLVPERTGWRSVRHYAYVDRPYEDVWPALARAPRQVLGGDDHGPGGGETSPLHVRRAGIEVSRDIRMSFGGIVCDDERARLAVRWVDARHPRLFPLLEAVVEVAPVAAGHRAVTQVGLVGRYRPPFGAVGGIADRMAGAEVAEESVARFVEEVARRLADLVPAQPAPAAEAAAEMTEMDAPPGGLRRVFLVVDGLGDRAEGAAGLQRTLAAVPGVATAVVDPRAGMAEVDYDPARCHPDLLLALVDEEGPLLPKRATPHEEAEE